MRLVVPGAGTHVKNGTALSETHVNVGRDEGDLSSQALWRQVAALVHASRGEHAEAEQLAREAVGILDRTDTLTDQGDALSDLAQVLATAGRTEEAAAALEQALDRYERKKNLVMAERTREKLATTAARR